MLDFLAKRTTIYIGSLMKKRFVTVKKVIRIMQTIKKQPNNAPQTGIFTWAEIIIMLAVAGLLMIL